jgi:hypothetical protein
MSQEFSEDSFGRFVERAQVAGEVWGLRLAGDWAYCESLEYEETEVLLFWSEKALAQQHAQEDWAGHKATAIPLDEFVNKWLTGIYEDNALVGLDWTVDLEGEEIEPRELAEALIDG